MLYWMPNLMFPDAFMSAIAAVRDQSTLQMIATSTLQHDLQAGMVKTIEASATVMDDYADRFVL